MLRATQSTSDFTTLLENLMNKVLQAQYAITPDTWRTFCNTSSNPDFRAANRYPRRPQRPVASEPHSERRVIGAVPTRRGTPPARARWRDPEGKRIWEVRVSF